MKRKKRIINITPDWLAGFTQSDGSFVVSLENQKKCIPIRPTPIFNITQSINEYDLFLEIQKYLGVGKIYKNRNNVIYVVKSINDLVNVIIPLFDKHPVRGGKFLSYNIFKKVVLMVKTKKHLTLEGTIQIINLSYFMNNETTLRTEKTRSNCIDKLKSKYGILPNITNIELPIIDKTIFPLNLEFIRGLVDGDGSFNISFRTTRRRIGVNFTVVCELSSISVLNQLVDFFNCGAVYNLPSNAARFQVQTVNDMLNNILPKLNGIKFNTYKHYHFETTIKICEIIKNTGYKTNQDLKNIVNLAWDMNKSGNSRKINKEEYLTLFKID